MSAKSHKGHEPVANDVFEWTAKQALHAMQEGMISAEDYIKRLLERYHETESLNAFISVNEDRALQSARAVDTARANKQTLPPLAGLPLVVKDSINVVGFPTTAGTAILKDFYPRSNAPVVDVLVKSGAIVLGKTNLDETCRGFTGSNPTFGFSHNPYDTSRVPGGGSGGTAVALSARVAPVGLGSDTAGSARVPASFCGVTGLRPSSAGVTRNAWTQGSWTVITFADGVFPIAYSITTPAPMGRTVSDVALLNDIITGAPEPTQAVALSGKRLGVPRGAYWENLDSEVRQVCERALDELRQAGVTLIDVDLNLWEQACDQAFYPLGYMHGIKDVADFLQSHAPYISVNDLVSNVATKDIRDRFFYEIFNPVPPDVIQQARLGRIQLAKQFKEFLRSQDLSATVYPTMAILPPPIRPGGDHVDDTIDLNGQQVNQFATMLRNTYHSGVVGIPSLTLCPGLSSSGLPVGLSFDGLTGHDSDLLGLGLAVEDLFGHPPAPNFNPGNRAASPARPHRDGPGPGPAGGEAQASNKEALELAEKVLAKLHELKELHDQLGK